VTANPPTTGYHRLKLALDVSPLFVKEEKKCPREALSETREREWQNLDDMLVDDVVSDRIMEIKLLHGMCGRHGISQSVQEETFFFRISRGLAPQDGVKSVIRETLCTHASDFVVSIDSPDLPNLPKLLAKNMIG